MSDTSNTVENSTAHNIAQGQTIGVIIMDAHGPVHTGNGDQIIYSTSSENHGPSGPHPPRN
ncbi:hypothetical protein [Streptomyces hygroscopicus]|uniref:hypothetical protein n=1 Tax=Streptomyces hygroscopicus TaxID=1912 RepID=UPI000783D87A|nr:hypothetical protein [Streptomyces hygroscopicus]